MTFSIVGRSDDGDHWGVAVASKFLAVGSAVPAARLDIGAIATQAMANTLFKRQGLAALEQGRSAQETLSDLIAGDDGREHRQVGIVDAQGGSATFTGSECLDWAGGINDTGVAIQGNILVGPDVVGAMSTAWHEHAGASLADRLMAALTTGDASGGDRRGRQSAALLVVSRTGAYTAGDDLAIDLRVDDHPNPVPELARLLTLHRLHFDTPDEADLLPLEGDLMREVDGLLDQVGQPDLETWAGVENFEVRLRPGRIDPVLLDQLRRRAAS